MNRLRHVSRDLFGKVAGAPLKHPAPRRMGQVHPFIKLRVNLDQLGNGCHVDGLHRVTEKGDRPFNRGFRDFCCRGECQIVRIRRAPADGIAGIDREPRQGNTARRGDVDTQRGGGREHQRKHPGTVGNQGRRMRGQALLVGIDHLRRCGAGLEKGRQCAGHGLAVCVKRAHGFECNNVAHGFRSELC